MTQARRSKIAFTAIITVLVLTVTAVGGLWIADLQRSRDFWHDAAVTAQRDGDDWAEKYTSLYDEYVQDTGHLPGADAPADVAEQQGQNEAPATPDARSGETAPSNQGSPGPMGPAGPAVTAAQLAAQIALYCADDTCVGQAGKDGTDGTDGADSTVPGPDGKDSTVPGPSPTAEQISQAVATFCADGRCNGPAGKDGAPGKDSTVPGATGDRGEPGPACPDGYAPGAAWINTADTPDGTYESRQVIICQPVTTEGDTP